MRFEVAPLPLDVVVCFFLWTGIVPSLWEFVWNVSRNGICLYYYLVYPSLGRLYFTHNSGWHHKSAPTDIQHNFLKSIIARLRLYQKSSDPGLWLPPSGGVGCLSPPVEYGDDSPWVSPGTSQHSRLILSLIEIAA